MKLAVALIGIAGMLTFHAAAQYRVVRGEVFARNAPDWIAIRDTMEVIDVRGRLLVCQAFLEQDVVTPAGGSGNAQLWPVHHTERSYGEVFVITNYPSVGILKAGDVIQPPVLVMEVSNPRVRVSETDEFHQHQDSSAHTSSAHPTPTIKTSTSTSTAHNRVTAAYGSRGPLYDYGTDYVPPPVKLTPEQAAAARAAAEKQSDAATEATFKFHMALAQDGNAGSQFRLGQLYLEGKGCAANTNEAKAWFEKAAAQGNGEAKAQLKLLP